MQFMPGNQIKKLVLQWLFFPDRLKSTPPAAPVTALRSDFFQIINENLEINTRMCRAKGSSYVGCVNLVPEADAWFTQPSKSLFGHLSVRLHLRSSFINGRRDRCARAIPLGRAPTMVYHIVFLYCGDRDGSGRGRAVALVLSRFVQGESKMVCIFTTHFSLDWVDGSWNPLRYLMPRVLGFIWCIILVGSVRGALWNKGYISDQICNTLQFPGNLTHMEASQGNCMDDYEWMEPTTWSQGK